MPQGSADHAPQPGLLDAGPAAALCELDVVVGADVGALRRVLGRLLDGTATLGLSSSLLGTLDPLAMPGGFRPFDLGQPDLLVWVHDATAENAAAGGAAAAEDLAGLATSRRRVVGPCRELRRGPGAAVPRIGSGPGAGGTYLVLVPGPDDGLPAGPDVLVEPADGGAPTAVLLRGDLDVLAALDRRAVVGGGLYLVPDLATARRLTAPAGG